MHPCLFCNHKIFFSLLHHSQDAGGKASQLKLEKISKINIYGQKC